MLSITTILGTVFFPKFLFILKFGPEAMMSGTTTSATATTTSGVTKTRTTSARSVRRTESKPSTTEERADIQKEEQLDNHQAIEMTKV
jgi:hypothetical protein